MTASTPMLITFLVYILGMVLIGFIAYRATQNFDDYILGGRRMGGWVTAPPAGARKAPQIPPVSSPAASCEPPSARKWIAVVPK